MESTSIYTEARNEYLKQLSTWIIPPLVEFFRKEYNTIAEKEGRKAMGVFQSFCSEVPKWNQDIINTNANLILDSCRCDYVEELMTAVFIAHTKMLTAVRVNSKQKKLQITLPKLDHFLHRVFTECARMFWKAPFLFSEELSMIERQKNILQAETMCTEALSGAIRSLLPVKNILRDYLENDEADGADGADSGEPEDSLASSQERSRASTQARKSPSDRSPSSANDESDRDSVAESIESLSSLSEPVLDFDIASDELQAPTSKRKRKSKSSGTTTGAVAVLEKLDSTSTPAASAPSAHVVVDADVKPAGLVIEKIEGASNPNPPELIIDTERSVHFTPYDTVFDHSNSNSEIQYVPKISVEDKPPSTWGLEDEGPKLTISDASTSILGEEIVDLDAPAPAPALALAAPAPAPAAVAPVLDLLAASPAPTLTLLADSPAPTLTLLADSPALATPATADATATPATTAIPVVDIDAPLASTSDFEELS